ncbi:MAG: dGTP triphosphohydrolase [Neisseriaceae bacterium]
MTNKRMDWKKLLCKDKLFPSSIRVNDDNDRSEFERDLNKITFSPFFRNLQNKTQLFPKPESAFIHSRLTHSLEVSSVGRSIANLVAKKIIANKLEDSLPENFSRDLSDIVGAACLLHDVGNPPFGHSGEDAISSFFKENSLVLSNLMDQNLVEQLSHFDGNAQVVRIIRTSHNLNVTLATIASVIKYPTVFNLNSVYKAKHSIFNSELGVLKRVVEYCGLIKLESQEYCRHPLVFLVEAADDICYKLLDLEDAHKIGLISFNDAYNLLIEIIIKKNKDAQFIQDTLKNLTIVDKFAKIRSYALNILIGEVVDKFIYYYEDIMTGDYTRMIQNHKLLGLIDLLILEDTPLSSSLKEIAKYVANHAYSYQPLLEIELAGYEILNYLLDQFTFATLEENQNSKRSVKLLKLLPERYESDSDDPGERLMQATDYISGLTDKMALSLYRKLKGIDLADLPSANIPIFHG